MRQLLLALTLVALSLAAVGAGRAQAMDDTCVHAPTISSLHDCVQHAIDQGFIDNAGIGTSLLAKVDAAQAALDRGKPAVAVNTLGAFIAAVTAQAGVHIDAQHAAHLVGHAQLVIQALGG